MEICRQIDDREGEGAILNNLGQMASEQGDYSVAREYLRQAVDILRDIGNPRVEGFALANLGLLHLRIGDLSGAGGYLEEGMRVLRTIGDPQGQSLALAYCALRQHLLGESKAAEAASRESLRIAENVGDRAAQAYALTTLGHALAALDSREEAFDAYQGALEIRLGLEQLDLACEAYAGLASLAVANGDVERAKLYVDAILDHLEAGKLDGTLEPLRVYGTCVEVLRALNDARADDVLDEATLLLHQQAFRVHDEALKRTFFASEHAAAIQALRDTPSSGKAR